MKNNYQDMGIMRAKLMLVNTADEIKAEEGMIKDADIRKSEEDFLVDTGSYMLAINEVIRVKLGLRKLGVERYELADGQKAEFDVVGPISVYFENRNTLCRALVLPGNTEPLLGVIPLEDMDVVLNPRHQTIMVNPEHPDMPVKPLK